jgi:hypothetical protein
MVFLDKEYMRWVLERGQPSLDELLLGRVFPQPSYVEGNDCEGSFRHASRALGRPTGRSIPCGGLDPVLGCAKGYLHSASKRDK